MDPVCSFTLARICTVSTPVPVARAIAPYPRLAREVSLRLWLFELAGCRPPVQDVQKEVFGGYVIELNYIKE